MPMVHILKLYLYHRVSTMSGIPGNNPNVNDRQGLHSISRVFKDKRTVRWTYHGIKFTWLFTGMLFLEAVNQN